MYPTQRNSMYFDCVIAVPEYQPEYFSILISSSNKIVEAGGIEIDRTLQDLDLFDGCNLNDNLTKVEPSSIPKEPGLYSCKIEIQSIKSWTDCGYEYDTEVYLLEPKILNS